MTTQRIEVVTSVERRRRSPRVEKERIVGATFEPGASVSDVARAADIHASQLFRWRRALCQPAEPARQLLPVSIAPMREMPAAAPGRSVAEQPIRERQRKAAGVIEIELESGCLVRVDRDVDAEALSRVLDILGRR